MIPVVNPAIPGLGGIRLAKTKAVPLAASYHTHLPKYLEQYGCLCDPDQTGGLLLATRCLLEQGERHQQMQQVSRREAERLLIEGVSGKSLHWTRRSQTSTSRRERKNRTQTANRIRAMTRQ